MYQSDSQEVQRGRRSIWENPPQGKHGVWAGTVTAGYVYFPLILFMLKGEWRKTKQNMGLTTEHWGVTLSKGLEREGHLGHGERHRLRNSVTGGVASAFGDNGFNLVVRAETRLQGVNERFSFFFFFPFLCLFLKCSNFVLGPLHFSLLTLPGSFAHPRMLI